MYTLSPLQVTLASSIRDIQAQIISTQNTLAAGAATLNPGEQGIVTRLSAQAASYGKNVQNITAAQNVISVGQTALSSIATILTQMQALATQASSAGMQSTDLTSLDTTFGQLKTQVQTLVTGASLNTNNVLAASSGTALSVITNPTGSTFSIDLQDVAAKTTSSAVTTGIGTAADASAALTSLTTMINDVSTAQGNLSAYSTGLQAVSDADTGLQNNLNATINGLTRIDSTALQTQLQNLNNQQSIDYYLVSQMNTESAAILAIFR